MDSRKLALLCRDFADNKKAENIVILDVRKLSSVTDYFVIASGTSEPHLRAIVEEITDKVRDEVRAASARGGRLGARRVGGAGFFRRDRPRHAPGRARALRSGKSLGRREAGEAKTQNNGFEEMKNHSGIQTNGEGPSIKLWLPSFFKLRKNKVIFLAVLPTAFCISTSLGS